MPPRDRKFRRFRVIPSEDGQTLQNLVTRRVPGFDRDKASEVIKAGGVYVNKLRVRLPMVRVAPGERITVYTDADEVDTFDPEQLSIVHRDPSFIVIDKPVGVPVTQTRETARGTLAEALRHRLEREGLTRPYVGVVHRLDRGASGLVLFTIRDIANKSLHRQFVEHGIERRYRLAVHAAKPPEAEFSCDAPLLEGRSGVEVLAPRDPRGVSACTHFTRLEAESLVEGQALLEARLETGRTHQIRAHAASLELPIVGDARYGRCDDPKAGLHLHAYQLRFDHPIEGGRVELEAPLPAWARSRNIDNASR